MNKAAKLARGRRSSSRARTWWPYAITGAVLVAIAAFAVVIHNGGSSSVSPGRGGTAGERGLPVGGLTPTQPLPSTSGGSISLAQMRGSKVIVYFYEGAS